MIDQLDMFSAHKAAESFIEAALAVTATAASPVAVGPGFYLPQIEGDRWAVYACRHGITIENMDDGPGPVPVIAPSKVYAEEIAALIVGTTAERCLAMAADRPYYAHLAEFFDRTARPAAEDVVAHQERHAKLLGCPVTGLAERLGAQADAEAKARREAQRWQAQWQHALAHPGVPFPGDVPAEAYQGRAKASRGAWKRGSAGKGASRVLNEDQRALLDMVIVDGQRARFTGGETPLWGELKLVLEQLGGTYKSGGKSKDGSFLFDDDMDVAAVIRAARETGEVLDKTLLGFFATSPELADRVVARVKLYPGARVLEPSAGMGALAKAVRRAEPAAAVSCVEILDENRAALERLGFELVARDFLEGDPTAVQPYDAIVANPPFDKGADVKHAAHMARFLRPGGTAAVITSGAVTFRSNAKKFRAFVESHGGAIEELPAGSFAQEGTLVTTCLVTWTACEKCSTGKCAG
jgi:predicted RNA methylase